MANREKLIKGFLNSYGWGEGDREHLADDASFRRYERVSDRGRKLILMDAPPDKEDIQAFVSIANQLCLLGCSAPKIFAADLQSGFLLLEDFGNETYTFVLNNDPKRERELYILAVDVLIHLQTKSLSQAFLSGLQKYSVGSIIDEAFIFLDWYLCQVLETPIARETRSSYQKVWKNSLSLIENQPYTLVLRDYHVDNLVWLEGRSGISACGLLDFQDAIAGSGIYDLVSLLEDARRGIGMDLKVEMKERYFNSLSNLNVFQGNRNVFEQIFAVLGASRHAKVIGIFTRLAVRDGKFGYLEHIPHVWSLLEDSLEHPALRKVKAWFDKFVPKYKRQIPVLVEKT